MNPRAGARFRGELVDQLHDELAKFDLTTEAFTDIQLLRTRAAELLETEQLRAVVAAGGDGTIALLANHTPPGAPLAILPLGTENLLAKYLELSSDAAVLAQIISDGYTQQFDMGEANGQLFSLMAGCGFDAEVVRRLHSDRRGNIHHWSYIKPILDSIRNYEYPELRVRYAPAEQAGDELTEELSARWAFVVNIPRYAGGLNLAPGAEGDDGLLDVCTFREGSLWNGLVYLGGVLLGQHESMQDYSHIRTRRLVITAEPEAPFQLDGDPGGMLPLDICIRPKRLTVLVSHYRAVTQQPQAVESPAAK
ncbi:diacylglycerol/lipid kinase family protein [Anatilimnocola aggregata]|uniref:diacylglycerol/lipid kinase family protein n=1 Tax=Anatilimnocola aggregata TaxID=2528021 RepID=UPI00192E38F0